MTNWSKCVVSLLALVAILTTGCSNPETQLISTWVGTAKISIPPTGNAALDAAIAKGPQQTNFSLTLNKDKSYVETGMQLNVAGTWALSGNTLTLTPKTINGKDATEAKNLIDSQMAQAHINMPPMPGMSGPEQVTVAPDFNNLTITALGNPLKLERLQDAGTS